jgi:hypothetical protein
MGSQVLFRGLCRAVKRDLRELAETALFAQEGCGSREPFERAVSAASVHLTLPLHKGVPAALRPAESARYSPRWPHLPNPSARSRPVAPILKS